MYLYVFTSNITVCQTTIQNEYKHGLGEALAASYSYFDDQAAEK
jgi:hypothetical protein